MDRGRERGGLVGVVAVVATLAGTLLWLHMIMGPLRLATGLVDARRHLNRTRNTLASGAIKKARYEILAGAAAAERAHDGLGSDSPLFDVARLVPAVDDALGETDHLVRAAELSANAAVGILDIADNALSGPNRIIADDPDDPKGGSIIRLDRVAAIGRTITDVRTALADVRRELGAVELSNLPSRARPSVTKAIAKADDLDAMLVDADAGFELLPGFLGGEGPRTYLIAMQNPAELRGSGGSILQFSTMTMTDGRAKLRPAKTVYEIDVERRQIDIPLPNDAWYVAAIPDARRFGNANWSPDWPLSARLTVDYARAADPSFPEVDGVIAMDPFVLQELIPGVGPYRIDYGNRITSKSSVHFLLHKAYGRFPRAFARRRALGQIVDLFYERMLAPKYPSLLVQGMGDALAHKHIQIWLNDADEQRFIEKMSWDGAIDPARNRDYVNVVQQNVGGNKLDYHARQTTTMAITPSDDDVAVTTTIDIANDVFLPLPEWPLGNSGPWHRPMVNLYVPERAVLRDAMITPVGARVDAPEPARWAGDRPPEHFEVGKKVWSATLGNPALDKPGIPPGEHGAVTFRYTVPDVVATEEGRRVYRLVVQHQAKAHPELLEIEFRLPLSAQRVRADGFTRRGDVLHLKRVLMKDIELEISWQE